MATTTATTQSNRNTGDSLVDATASIGRISAFIGVIFGSVVGVGLIILGLYIVITDRIPPFIGTSNNSPSSASSSTSNPSTTTSTITSTTNKSPALMGGIFIGIGVVAIVIAWLIYWGTQKSKAFALFEGIGSIGGLLSGRNR